MTQTEQSEWRTRKRLIDPKLEAAGWRVVKYDPSHAFGKGSPVAIEEFPTENGPADYALCADGQLLGVVEAKKLTLGPQNALTQAERYARGATTSPFSFHGFRVPFLYATKGEVLWHHDVLRDVAKYGKWCWPRPRHASPTPPGVTAAPAPFTCRSYVGPLHPMMTSTIPPPAVSLS